jgi:hypothetical protein
VTTETKVEAVARLEITAHGRGEWSAHESAEGMFVLYAQHQSALDALRGEVVAAERRVAELIEADKEYDLAKAGLLACTNKPAHLLVTIIDYADAARGRFEAAKARRAAALTKESP